MPPRGFCLRLARLPRHFDSRLFSPHSQEWPGNEPGGGIRRRISRGQPEQLEDVVSLDLAHLFRRLGLMALLRNSVGDQGMRDDDYGNEEPLFLKD